jgi:hypothetical protein
MKCAVNVALIFLIHFYAIFPVGVADPALSRSEIRVNKPKNFRKAKMERRQYSRVKISNLVSYVGRRSNGEILEQSMGKALNISQSGIFIETPQMVFSEFISLMSVDDNNNLVEIIGEVIYSTVYKTGTYGVGIRFEGMHTENIRFVTKLIKVFNIRKYELAAAVNLYQQKQAARPHLA